MSLLAARDTTSVVVDGLRISYESVGAGGSAVVFVHGAFEDRSYFDLQAAHLAPRRRVIRVDLRGHGASDVPQSVSIDDFVSDVIAVMEAAGVDGAVLCGHSMGGVVALKVAALRPNLVRGVVMLDATVLFPEPLRRQALDTFVPVLGTDRWLEALRGWFARTLDPRDPPEVSARVMADLGRARPRIAQTFFEDLFVSDYADLVAGAPCPILYLHAKAPTDIARFLELRPDALVGQVVGSGHYLMLSVPEQVDAMLDRFLAIVEAERASDPP